MSITKYLWLFLVLNLVGQAQTTDWESLSSPSTFDRWIACMTEYNGELVVGGLFSEVDGVMANGIASWDGTGWSSFDDGIGGDMLPYLTAFIENMAVHDDKLYVVGLFSQDSGYVGNNIAMWDGSAWDDLDGGANDRVFDLGVYEDEIYVTGYFDSIGGVEAHSVAKWNGTNWVSLDSVFGENSISIVDFHNFNDDLYFTGGQINLDTINCIAVGRFDGDTWECISDNLIFNHTRLGNWNDTLLVGANSALVDGEIQRQIHRLDGNSWDIFSSQADFPLPQEYIEYEDELYFVGGWPAGINSSDTTGARVMKWDGSEWQKVGTGLSSVVEDVMIYNGELYIVGGFSEDLNSPHNYIAKLSHNIGLEENEGINFSIFPNPTASNLSIEMKNFEGSISISDISGRLLNRFDIPEQTDSYTMDVSVYTSGVYILNFIRTDGIFQTEKIIVQ